MKKLLAIVLLALIFTVKSGLDYLKVNHERAILVSSVQSQKKERDKLNGEWYVLKSEQKSKLGDAQLSFYLKNQLDMIEPNASDIVYLK